MTIIQVVGYLHRWKTLPKDEKDGSFVYWNDNTKEDYVPSTPLLGMGRASW